MSSPPTEEGLESDGDFWAHFGDLLQDPDLVGLEESEGSPSTTLATGTADVQEPEGATKPTKLTEESEQEEAQVSLLALGETTNTTSVGGVYTEDLRPLSRDTAVPRTPGESLDDKENSAGHVGPSPRVAGHSRCNKRKADEGEGSQNKRKNTDDTRLYSDKTALLATEEHAKFLERPDSHNSDDMKIAAAGDHFDLLSNHHTNMSTQALAQWQPAEEDPESLEQEENDDETQSAPIGEHFYLYSKSLANFPRTRRALQGWLGGLGAQAWDSV